MSPPQKRPGAPSGKRASGLTGKLVASVVLSFEDGLVSGTLAVGDHPTEGFSGWLGLMSRLDAAARRELRDAPVDPGAP